MAYLFSSIKHWPLIFKLLYLLIIFDGLATYWGLNMGVIIEGNPLMAIGFNSYPLLTLFLKLGLSLIFLEVIYYAIHIKKIKWPAKVMPALIIIHAFIATLHLNWIGSQLYNA